MSASIREISFAVDNARGDAVDCDLRFVEGGGAKPVVVFCHGFKGFKDWGPYPEWGRRLARAGFVSVHMNFSYNGVHRDAPTAFTELDKFADNTFTRELDDLQAVLDATDEGQLPEAPADPNRIGLLGHSRGGGTVILQTDRDDRVGALVTWSSVATFVDRFSDEQIADWETQGYTEIRNSRTGQVMRLNKVLYDDTMAHRDELDVPGAASRIDVPWLVVHARDDEAVDFEAAETLAGANDSAELFEAEGGHTFGGAHPFDGTVPESLETVWTRTIDFFRTHLGNT
ncbi:MAG: alpha/beta hydrolase [Bacteroidetes bacterium QH_2_63_10]|nr:MAG: alpha/beta hydrolase [Bacteroidetes bacterium QH_2_63_10]